MAFLWEVIDLIERVNRNREAYLSSEYNEAQVRLELNGGYCSVGKRRTIIYLLLGKLQFNFPNPLPT